jgi:hypothetical protein
MAERFADDEVGADDLVAVRRIAVDGGLRASRAAGLSVLTYASSAVERTATQDFDPVVDSTHVSRKVAEALAFSEVGVPDQNLREWTERLRQISADAEVDHPHILRCIFGNPFRPSTIQPHLISDTIQKVAIGIYEQRSFDQLAILADALEECGVTDREALAHCRSGGPHARGCHVLDLILGKA